MSGLGNIVLKQHQPVVKKKQDWTIKSVKAFVIDSKQLEEKSGGGADCHSQGTGHWIVDSYIANPMSCYQEYKKSRTSWGINALGSTIVEVELYNGIKGIGITIGGEPACYIVEHHLSRFVEGQDIHCIELIWDQMWKSTINYGRKGVVIQAISAIDLALYDALGKLKNEPVYNLLGGKTKEKIPIYATTSRADLAKQMGFAGAKVPLPFGPGDGDEGMKKNIEFIAQQRQSVGEDFPLMIDCYMALTVQYTIRLAKLLEPYNIKWIEECLIPDDYDGWKQVRQSVHSTMLTTGEHEYTRYGFRKLLETRAIDVLQPDITWCGGITEAKRIVALAAAYDIPVVPHGSSIFSYHLQIVFPNCPIAEYLILSPKADTIVPLFGNIYNDEPLPSNGFVELSTKPGFGVTLNEELLLRQPYKRTLPYQVSDNFAKYAELLKNCEIVDSHVHITDIDKIQYNWIVSQNQTLQNYLQSFQKLNIHIKSVVFMEADAKESCQLDEIKFVDSQGSQIFKAQICSMEVEKGSEYVKQTIQKIKTDHVPVRGVRRLIQEKSLGFCNSHQFIDGVQAVLDAGLIFELCIRSWKNSFELSDSLQLLKTLKNGTVVINHIGKPDFDAENFEKSPWVQWVKEIAKIQNNLNIVWKLSGVITECQNFSFEKIFKSFEFVIKTFGPEKCIFGSDWFVAEFASNGLFIWLETFCQILENVNVLDKQQKERNLTLQEKQLIFGLNAKKVYKIQ